MEVTFWWMLPLWLAVIGAVAWFVIRRERSRDAAAAASLPVANSERLTQLPGYQRALRRYRVLVFGLVTSIVLVLVAGVGLSMRFARLDVTQPDLKNRDIVLCLDVSGSMIDYDTEVVDVFSDLAERFQGERISLVVFNASAVTYFPLTSDYDYIQKQFAQLQEEFAADEEGTYYRGTLLGNGSSLVGDGLATCAVRFDATDEPRSRSVILVTDNLIAGEPIFTLPEAGQLASERNVRVYGINPGDGVTGCLTELTLDNVGPFQWSPAGDRVLLNSITVFDGTQALPSGYFASTLECGGRSRRAKHWLPRPSPTITCSGERLANQRPEPTSAFSSEPTSLRITRPGETSSLPAKRPTAPRASSSPAIAARIPG